MVWCGVVWRAVLCSDTTLCKAAMTVCGVCCVPILRCYQAEKAAGLYEEPRRKSSSYSLASRPRSRPGSAASITDAHLLREGETDLMHLTASERKIRVLEAKYKRLADKKQQAQIAEG